MALILRILDHNTVVTGRGKVDDVMELWRHDGIAVEAVVDGLKEDWVIGVPEKFFFLIFFIISKHKERLLLFDKSRSND